MIKAAFILLAAFLAAACSALEGTREDFAKAGLFVIERVATQDLRDGRLNDCGALTGAEWEACVVSQLRKQRDALSAEAQCLAAKALIPELQCYVAEGPALDDALADVTAL